MNWSLPPNWSTQGVPIDRLFWIIFWITAVAFVLVELGVLWFAIRYRNREGGEAKYTHGNNALEVVWTAFPALVLVALGIYSGRLWADIRFPASFPEDALTISVVAKQFEWNITYPGADMELGNADDFTIRNQFHIPANRKVVVRLEAEDVLHSFFLPELRVKQDAVPGMVIPIWFEATQPAEFQITCAELCGLGHYRMRGRVKVHEGAAYDQWYSEQSQEAIAALAAE